MSKTAARRVALFASSSLGLAAIASAASLGAALAPTTAAAAVTCVSTPAPTGNGTNDVVYAAGTYNPEITCVYVGDNGEVSTAGAITVSTSAPGGGINLSATGTSDIDWDSTAGTVTGGNQTNGPVIDALTESGDITLTIAGVTGSQATITHGIRAWSTGGGDIGITHLGSNFGISATNSGGGVAAIEAVATGGNGDVTITLPSTNNSAVSGRLYGILAQASGTGDLTVTHHGGVRANPIDPNAIGMDLTAGTGKLTVNSVGQSATIGHFGDSSNYAGTGLRASYGGDAEFNLHSVFANAHANGANWMIDLSTAANTTTTLDIAGLVAGGRFSGSGVNAQTLRVTGGADVDITLSGELRGFMDLSGAGVVTASIDDGGDWLVHGTSQFSDSADVLTIGADGRLQTRPAAFVGSGVTGQVDTAVIDFGDGDDRLTNTGVIIVGGSGGSASPSGNWEFRIENLETFESFGTIVMGASNQGMDLLESDEWTDDMLVLPGVHFVGNGQGVIVLDANLSAAQSACDPGQRDPDTLHLPAADCLRIENGSTSGVTRILVNELVPGDRGGLNQIVLVDMAGGTSETGHFVLHEDSPGYNPDNGGYIDKGFFIYPLVYDASTQQHKLAGAPGGDAQQFTLLAQAGHGLWRLSTGSWLDRQADLRGRLLDGGGGWMRLTTEFADRDIVQTVDVLGNPFTFDNTHEQSSYAVTGGFDIVAGGAWVVGLTAGYVNSEVDYDRSPNTAQFDGWAGGAYASYVSGPLFVDAIVNTNKLILKADIPALGLEPEGTIVETNLLSAGGQVEAGYRFGLGGGAFIEPLGGLTYVRTEYDDLRIASDDPVRPPVVVEFDDPASLRGSLGARVGLDQRFGGLSAQYSLLGRVWNEFEDETRAIGVSPGSDAVMVHDNPGTISEFGVGVSVWGLNEALSGFFNFGGKFGDDYQSQNLSAGVRVNW